MMSNDGKGQPVTLSFSRCKDHEEAIIITKKSQRVDRCSDCLLLLEAMEDN